MEEYESISLIDLLNMVRNYLVVFILLAITGGGILGAYTILTEHDEYLCTSAVVISKESAKVFYEDNYTQSDITMYEKITDTYVEIAKSNTVLKEVTQSMTNYNKKQIASMVKVSVIPNTLILQIETYGRNQSDIYKISHAYLNAMIHQCATVLPAGDLTILDEPEFPTQPLPSHLARNIAIGITGGILLGFSYVLLRMFLDNLMIQNLLQIEKYIGLKVQTTLLMNKEETIKKKRREKNGLLHGNQLEPIRALANDLIFMKKEKITSLAFTSHCPQQGKTELIETLGQILAKRGYKTLIIDGNYFTPSITRRHMLENRYGLLNLLEIETKTQLQQELEDLNQYISHCTIKDLQILPVGIRKEEKEIMMEANIKQIMVYLNRLYDFILVETPSLEDLSYVQSMCQHTNEIFLVLRAGTLKITDAVEVKEKIEKLPNKRSDCIFNKQKRQKHGLPQSGFQIVIPEQQPAMTQA